PSQPPTLYPLPLHDALPIFPACTPRFLNLRWAKRVSLDLSDGEWSAHFCRFEPLTRNLDERLALRYHGHQFRVYNPEIGDGRGRSEEHTSELQSRGHLVCRL